MPESHMEVGCVGSWRLEPPTPNPGDKKTPKACPTCNPAMSPARHTWPQPLNQESGGEKRTIIIKLLIIRD